MLNNFYRLLLAIVMMDVCLAVGTTPHAVLMCGVMVVIAATKIVAGICRK